MAALYLLAVTIFGGRINFWQSLAVVFWASLPVVLITKVLSLIILFVKDPDDVHPILGQETLVQDNLGVLFYAWSESNTVCGQSAPSAYCRSIVCG